MEQVPSTEMRRCTECGQMRTADLIYPDGRCHRCAYLAQEGESGAPPAKRGRPKKAAADRAEEEKTLRAQAVAAYSANRRCACCKTKDPRVLMIAPRVPNAFTMAMVTTPKMLRKLRSYDWPPGYRVLCADCWYARQFWWWGRCLHKEKQGEGATDD